MTYRAKPQDGVAWVTGASSGIGRAAARELARRGYTVAATARRLDELETLAREPVPGEGRIVAHSGDVTDEGRMAEIVATIEQVHGPIALAFLNAGVAPLVRGAELDPAAFRQAFEVNVMGVVNGLAPVAARMAGRRRGQIAINASIAGYGGLPQAAAYGASKAALIYICESLRLDFEKSGITLQVVNPGFVDTPLTQSNKFPMPFLMRLDDAAQRLCNGLEHGGFEIAFPSRLAYLVKALNLLPYRLYFQVLARAARGRKR